MTGMESPLSSAAVRRVAELVAEIQRLSARMNQATAELNTLVGPATKPQDPEVARYLSPEFTRQLVEHMHRAKRAAILEDSGSITDGN